MKVRHLGRAALAGAILAAVLILVLSVTSTPPPPGPPNADKVEHLFAYLVLAFLATAAVRMTVPGRRGRLLGAVALAGCVAYGVALELLQGAIGRDCNVYDALFDLGGCLLGWGAATLASRRIVAATSEAGTRPPAG